MSKPFRILAMDDSLTIRKLVQITFQTAEFAVEVASSGKEGIDLARRSPPDLLLLDYMLPDMRGTDVCAALEHSEQTRRVPIIVMSAKADDVVPLFRNAKAVTGFMHKPFNKDEARAAVGAVVAKRRSEPVSGEQPAAPAAPPSAHAAPPPAPAAPPQPAQAPAAAAPAVREQVARALFGALKDAFARIPELAKQPANEPPALFFGKRILTPATIDLVIAAVAPLLQPAAHAGGADAALALVGTQVPARAEGFSRRLAQARIGDHDRRVLALVDGQIAVAAIHAKSGLGAAEVVQVLATLCREGLIVLAAPGAAAAAPAATPAVAARIAILDAEDGRVAEPLRRHLADRPRPVDVTILPGSFDAAADALRKARPHLLLLATAAPAAEPLLQLARTDAALAGTTRIALTTAPGEAPAGYDQCLVQPFALTSIDQLLFQQSTKRGR